MCKPLELSIIKLANEWFVCECYEMGVYLKRKEFGTISQ